MSLVLRRIAARSGAAIWRHRIGVLGGVVIVGAFSVYQLSYAVPISTSTNGDCADATMAAVTQVNDAVAHAAYACLGPGMRTTSEDQFVANMHQRAVTSSRVNRIGDESTADGGRIVFFTVDGQGSAIGYIVYLDPRGQVVKVE